MKGKLYSVFTGTCPKCNEGRVFIYRNPYNLKHIGKMNRRCDKCGQDFLPEPGFYFGAGYVSYALGVAIAVTISVAMSPWIPFFKNFELYATVIIGTILILTPALFRASRLGWLNFFFKYDPHAIEKHQESLKEHQQNI